MKQAIMVHSYKLCSPYPVQSDQTTYLVLR